jgi:hypothetical protein
MARIAAAKAMRGSADHTLLPFLPCLLSRLHRLRSTLSNSASGVVRIRRAPDARTVAALRDRLKHFIAHRRIRALLLLPPQLQHQQRIEALRVVHLLRFVFVDQALYHGHFEVRTGEGILRK